MSANNLPAGDHRFWLWFSIDQVGEGTGWNAEKGAGEMIRRVTAHDPDWSGTYRFPTMEVIALGPVHTPIDEVIGLEDDEDDGDHEDPFAEDGDEEEDDG